MRRAKIMLGLEKLLLTAFSSECDYSSPNIEVIAQMCNFAQETDLSHKSHNAPEHHLVTEMCTHVLISVTKWCIVGYGTGAL